MSALGWLEIIIVLALVVACAFPLGSFMAAIFEGRRTFLSPVVGPLERGLYRLSGVDPDKEQDWLQYTLSMLIFTGGCFLGLYSILRSQAVFPFNPQGRDGVAPDLSFNTAISFITNANWQAYAARRQ